MLKDMFNFLFSDSGIGIVILVMFFVNMLWLNRRRFFGKTGLVRSTYVNEASFIMSFYTQGHMLQSVKRGMIQNLRYNIFITLSNRTDGLPESNSDAGSVLYMIELPFHARGHVIGISKKSKIERFYLESYIEANGLKQIKLEGDYPSQFSIYAAPGQETIARYILDPAAMAFTVEYCTNHFWEIVGDEMYFSTVNGLNDGTNVLESSVKFAEQVRPATADSASSKKLVKHDKPYGELSNKSLNCPICNTEMEITQYWYACKNQHGILVQGRDLSKIKDGTFKVEKTDKAPVQHEGLKCPNCGKPMHALDYLRSGVIIDSCENCVFRWLDTNEAYKLTQPKYSLNAAIKRR